MDNPEHPPPLDVRGLLRRYNLSPRKRLGQNFLVDLEALQRVVEVAEIAAQDAVLEVGPGLGGLTRLLARSARDVVAVELDAGMIEPLEEVLSSYPNVRLVQGDILDQDIATLVDTPGYLVVANIPYYITSALIQHLLEAPVSAARLVLTVQKEVAQRICAPPGKMSLLSLSVQIYGEPAIRASIPAAAFFPQPKVDSSVVRVDVYPQPRVPSELRAMFFRLIKAGFRQKRKNLRNALAAGMGWPKAHTEEVLEKAGISPRRRAETLAIKEWLNLVIVVAETTQPDT